MGLSSGLLELPHGMVAGFQEQVSRESGSGCSQFLKAQVQKLALHHLTLSIAKQSRSPDSGEVT